MCAENCDKGKRRASVHRLYKKKTETLWAVLPTPLLGSSDPSLRAATIAHLHTRPVRLKRGLVSLIGDGHGSLYHCRHHSRRGHRDRNEDWSVSMAMGTSRCATGDIKAHSPTVDTSLYPVVTLLRTMSTVQLESLQVPFVVIQL